MSSFLKRGERQMKLKIRKEVKSRIKQVYYIMDELDDVANMIYNAGDEYNEENIAEVAGKYTDLKIEGLETLMLLGKLKTKQDHEDKLKESGAESTTTD
jgi:DUF1009 family protein